MAVSQSPRPWSPDTLVVSAGRPARKPDAPLNAPVEFASALVQGGAVGYARYGGPNYAAFEAAIGALEGGRSLAFASGMAAVSAVLDLVPAGGVVVSPNVAYAGTRALLRHHEDAGRIQVRRIDPADDAMFAQAIDGAALVWLESPTNPLLEVVDLAARNAAAQAVGAKTCVDATFSSPLRLQPLQPPIGSDISLHSATKFISGHSDVLMGVVSTIDDDLWERMSTIRKYGGAIPGPMETFLALRGLRTLSVRLERAERSTAQLLERLSEHRAITRIRYPGFGTMISIELIDETTADAFIDALTLWVPTTSLGSVESTLERRRRWPEESPTVSEALVRMSVGIEDVEDLWADLASALYAVTTPTSPPGS